MSRTIFAAIVRLIVRFSSLQAADYTLEIKGFNADLDNHLYPI